MKRFATTGAAVLLALGTLACGGEESPDQQGSEGQQPAAQQQQQQQTEVSDEELRAFAEATANLQSVAEQARSDMQSAEGQEEAQQVRQDFQEEQARIVQEAGLDTARYTEIRNAIEANPDLRDRFMKIRQEEQQ